MAPQAICRRSTEHGVLIRLKALARGQRRQTFELPWAALHRAALVCLGVLMTMMACAVESQAKMRQETLTLVTAGGARQIEIEVATTPDEKSMGLMFRPTLADGAGMLFPYSPPQELTMWMKNTYISLDMVFIKSDGRVHRIEARTEPLSERIVASQGDVAAVLELPGGAAERLGLKPGDSVLHAHFAPPKK
jgi:uncharacterized protein